MLGCPFPVPRLSSSPRKLSPVIPTAGTNAVKDGWFSREYEVSIKKEALVPIARCSACGAKVNYVGEQTGQTALCTGCNGNVVLRQSSMQVVQAAISILLAAISIGVLVFFGLVGGIVAWATHGTLIVIMGVLAIIFGMGTRRIPDPYPHLWMTVVGRAMLKSGRASRGTTDTYVQDVNPGRSARSRRC